MATLPTAAALATRCVHIKVYPTPRSLPERRQVLRVLERFGDVDMFRSLRYDAVQPVHNAFHSIFRTPSSATAAIAASPLRYTLVAEGGSSAATSNAQSQASLPDPVDLEAPVSKSIAETGAESEQELQAEIPKQRQSNTNALQENIFELRISHSTYPHLSAVASTPLHGPYSPISASRSAIAADLLNRLPPTAARTGIADWVTDGVGQGAGMSMRGVVGREVEVGGEGKMARTYVNKSMPWRVRDRMKAEGGLRDSTGKKKDGNGASG